MNITIVCRDFNRSSALMQPWRRIYEISRRLVAKKNTVTIVSDNNSIYPQFEKIDKIVINRINNLLLDPFVRKEKFLENILKNNPDIIIWNGTPLSAIYLNQLRSLGKPIIWDITTNLFNLKDFKKFSIREIFRPSFLFLFHIMLLALYPRLIIRKVANSHFISKIIVPSQHLKKSLCNIGVSAGKIAIITSSVDMYNSYYSNYYSNIKDFKKKLGLMSEDFIITYFGSPRTLRGTDTAIYSIQKIIRKFKKIRLVILSRRKLGESIVEKKSYLKNEEEYLKKLIIKLRLEDYVKIISGILTKSQVKQYIYASNAIVLPFKIILSEPPLSVLEAMSLGKVVITTNLGVLAEIISNERGILIEPGRSDMLAQKILYLVKHPEKAAYLAENARRYAMSLPNWDNITLQFINEFNEIY